MPRTWTTHWPLPDGRSAPADKQSGIDEAMSNGIAVRDALIHTLGNLTLVTVPANSVASNSAFDLKKTWLKDSLLALNLAILEKSSWNEDTIRERGASLADLAVRIWPAPPAYLHQPEESLEQRT